MPNTREKEKLTNIVCEAMEDGCIGHCNHPPCFQVERVVNALIANSMTVTMLLGMLNTSSLSAPPKGEYRGLQL